NLAALVRHHRIEILRVLDGKEQQTQCPLRERCESILGKPDGIRKTDAYMFVAGYQRQSLEDCVAKAGGLRLHCIEDGGRQGMPSKIVQNVGLPRRDHETNLAHAALDHPLNKIFTDGPGPLAAAIEKAADRQKFLRECQGLNTTTHSGRWNNTPHFRLLSRNCPGKLHRRWSAIQ